MSSGDGIAVSGSCSPSFPILSALRIRAFSAVDSPMSLLCGAGLNRFDSVLVLMRCSTCLLNSP